MTWKQCIAAVSAAFLLTSASLSASPRKKPAAKHSSQSKTKASSSRRGKPVAKRPPRQQTPSQERYREIQQVLAEKGYYAGEINGVWNSDSVEALKKFQAERNMVADGKLGALSIIALGLGPKRDASGALEAKPQSQP